MSIIEKLLIINTIPLPNEILNYIKPFIFYDIIHKSRKIKNKVISLINSNLNSLHYSSSLSKPSMWVFIVIQNDIKNYQHLSELNILCKIGEFCLKCGNYSKFQIVRKNQNILCKCDSL
jgi:hypothetical protein